MRRRDHENKVTEKEITPNEVYYTFFDEVNALPRIDRETVKDLNEKNIRALRSYTEAAREISLLELKLETARHIQREAAVVRDGLVDIATRLGYDPEWLKHRMNTSDAYREYMAEEAEDE